MVGSRSCEDCGNKAKRDCKHKRCRTCCKNRGFQCPTHVRSTWVPVARRRQLLHRRLSAAAALPSTVSSGFQQRMPLELNSIATFRCVRVLSDDNMIDQASYQASVVIGGHVFNGILYDQGPNSASFGGGGEKISSSDHLYLRHQLVGTSSVKTHPGGGVGSSVGGPNLADLNCPNHQNPYYASNAPFALDGMQLFPHPKP